MFLYPTPGSIAATIESMSSTRPVDRLFGIKDIENPRVVTSDKYDGAYVEVEPTTADYFREHAPTADSVRQYIRSLFPFVSWIAHYNLTWLLGDFIAGMPPLASCHNSHCRTERGRVSDLLQVSRLASLSFLRVWRMPSLPISLPSLACTRRSSASSCIGPLPRQKTSPSV